jgi:hypothetical protein
MNAESYPVAQLCVNTLLAIKVTLITGGIKFGRVRVNVFVSLALKYVQEVY